MTKIYKTEIIPAKPAETKTVVDYILCDVCKEAKGTENYRGEIKWNDDCYEFTNTTLTFEEGNNYGSNGGSSVRKEFHICPKCFEFTLTPLLKEHLGIQPHEIEKDW